MSSYWHSPYALEIVSIREETHLRASLREDKRFASRVTNKSVAEVTRIQSLFDSVIATCRHA
jgi:hypothetical protein